MRTFKEYCENQDDNLAWQKDWFPSSEDKAKYGVGGGGFGQDHMKRSIVQDQLHAEEQYRDAVRRGEEIWPPQLKAKILNLYHQIWQHGEDTEFKPTGVSSPHELAELMEWIDKADWDMGYYVHADLKNMTIRIGDRSDV